MRAHWLFSGRCALSFPALASLVSLASARGLAAVLRGAQASGEGGPWDGLGVVRVVTAGGTVKHGAA